MTQDSKKIDQYVKGLLGKKKSNPEALTDSQFRLVSRYESAEAALSKLENEAHSLANQLNQGQARLNSLKEQASNATGRLVGIVEAMAYLEFDDLGEAEKPEPEKKTSTPKPAKKTSKKKTTRKSA